MRFADDGVCICRRTRASALTVNSVASLGVGVTAPGLVVFSRFPILDMHFKRYSINGKMYQCAHSDYMLAKGVGLVRVDVSELAYPNVAPGACRPVVGVDIFLTHLHANYSNFYYDWRKVSTADSCARARVLSVVCADADAHAVDLRSCSAVAAGADRVGESPAGR
jgi:hypothetical protein